MKRIWIVAVLIAFHSGSAAAEGDCQQGPGTNWVDLCLVDRGNRLNTSELEYKELGRQFMGECWGQGYERGMRGSRYRVTHRVRYYDYCAQAWNEFEKTSEACEIK